RVEHGGTRDWSLEPRDQLDVTAGDFFEFEVWVRPEGEGTVTLCASTWDAKGKVVEWSYSSRTAVSGNGWRRLRTRFLVPDGIAHLQLRIIGYGKLSTHVDDFEIRKLPSPVPRRGLALAPTLTLTN